MKKLRVHNVLPDKYTEQIWTDDGHGSVMIAVCAGVDRKSNAEYIVRACNDVTARIDAELAEASARVILDLKERVESIESDVQEIYGRVQSVENKTGGLDRY